MTVNAHPSIIEKPELSPDSTSSGEHWIVTVFNNDYNTYAEVIEILIVATGCGLDEAYMEAWEIDHLGKSVVHHGAEEECVSVAEVVCQIGIEVVVSIE